MSRDLNKAMHTDEEVLLTFEDKQVFHFFGLVVRFVEVY